MKTNKNPRLYNCRDEELAVIADSNVRRDRYRLAKNGYKHAEDEGRLAKKESEHLNKRNRQEILKTQ